MNFSAALEKERGVPFLTAQIVDIVEETVLAYFLTGNNTQTYQRYIQLAKFLPQRLNILNIIEGIDGEEPGARKLDIAHLDDGSLFLS